jgi:hypothetical protein
MIFFGPELSVGAGEMEANYQQIGKQDTNRISIFIRPRDTGRLLLDVKAMRSAVENRAPFCRMPTKYQQIFLLPCPLTRMQDEKTVSLCVGT